MCNTVAHVFQNNDINWTIYTAPFLRKITRITEYTESYKQIHKSILTWQVTSGEHREHTIFTVLPFFTTDIAFIRRLAAKKELVFI